ncbi:MAG: hypothetical protein ACYTEQ_26975 [Planctomycetota bacterium]|jgi:hypothetical protein
MFGKPSILTVAVLLCLVGTVKGEQIMVTWDGGGDNHSWADEYNWNPDIVPGNTETDSFAVTIDGTTSAVEVWLLNPGRSIDSLITSGEVELYGDWVYITIIDGLTNYGSLEVGDLRILGNITNAAGAMLALDDVDVEGDIYNLPEGGMVISDWSGVRGNFGNYGWVVSTAAGDFLVDDGMFANNGMIQMKGGTVGAGISPSLLINGSSGRIWGHGIVVGGVYINNSGAIEATSGNLAVHTEGSMINTGTLSVATGSSLYLEVGTTDVNNAGQVRISHAGVFSVHREPLYSQPQGCTFYNDPCGTVSMLGGLCAAETIIQKAGAIFEGFGGITGDLIMDPDGIIRLTGPTNIVGDVSINPSATLEISDGITLVTGHTLCNNGTIHMKGGRLVPQGGFTNGNCNIIWEAGTYSNVADFNLDGKVNFKDFADFAGTWLWQAPL